MFGAAADERQQQALLTKHSDLLSKLPPLYEALANSALIPFTQWEAWLALYHGKSLMIAKASPAAPRGPRYAPTAASREAQADHLARLETFHRYPGSEFGSPDELAKQIAYSTILICWSRTTPRGSSSSATSPKGSSARWPNASRATRRSILTA
jgi:hypothetical protein